MKELKRYDKIIFEKDHFRCCSNDIEAADDLLKFSDIDIAFFASNLSTKFFADGITLRDIIKFLSEISPGVFGLIEITSSSNIVAYLEDFSNNPAPTKKSNLEKIEVYKTLHISNYDDLEVFDTYMQSCCHGILGDEMYAIEFEKWQNLIDVPVTIKDELILEDRRWKKCKPFRMKIRSTSGSDFRFPESTRKLSRKKVINDKMRSDLSMEEFFFGLFSEISFFWTPEYRAEENKKLDSILERIDSEGIESI